MEEFVVDVSKLTLLDQMLVDLDKGFDAVPASLKKLVTKASSVLRRLRNGLKCEFSHHVALLAREDPDGAVEALRKFCPDLKIDNVDEILMLIYADGAEDLQVAIGFVEVLELKLRRSAYELLYEEIQFKKHNDLPEMLMLQKCMEQVMLTNGGDSLFEVSLSRVHQDCLKIVDRIVEGVKIKDHELSIKIVETLGSSILEEKMTEIVKKVHSAGSLEETLLLIQFSHELPKTSNSCVLVQTLFELLQSKNLLVTKQGLHLWAHLRGIKESGDFNVVDRGVQERYKTTCSQLDENKNVYFELYRSYVENPDAKIMVDLHDDNCHMDSIGAEFVNFYYDGDLKKARFLLTTASNVPYFSATDQILVSLFKQMNKFGQMATFEYFAIFVQVKDLMSREKFSSLDASEKLPFEELKAKAPDCLRLLLWPETDAGAKFRLVNELLENPLYCYDSEAFFLLSAFQTTEQLWRAHVDTVTCLVTFSHEGRKLSSEVTKGHLQLTEDGTQWKIKAVDQDHIKIYAEDGQFFFCLFRGLYIL